jgi:epoxyqueuosine reductase
MSASALKPERLRRDAADCGLSLMAAAPAETAPALEERYRRWIDSGGNAGMQYLDRHAQLKYRPADVLPGTRTILVAAVSYYRPRRIEELPEGWGRVARYAWGRDYHKPLKKRLKNLARELSGRFPAASFKPFVDTAPIDERYYAARAGLGFIGRNRALILPGGSWYVIGEILTTLEADWSAWDLPEEAPSFAAGCPTGCRRCIRHCPTGALREDGGFDAGLCLSYLTIEHRGEFPEGLRAAAGDRVFGCDTCQEVCPLNSGARETPEDDFRRDIAGEAVELAPLLRLESREEMTGRFAGSPLLRASRERLTANAALAAANTGARTLVPEL